MLDFELAALDGLSVRVRWTCAPPSGHFAGRRSERAVHFIRGATPRTRPTGP
ncbi:hypothetical protein ACQ5JZ_23405 [Streptomyces sp. ZG43]|uniref:hypothetical protein n=1 Tax=Streptomyces sp. 604F TaxID=1476754 RepID=UPI0013D9EDFD|nr:hypothetical protein [Streptomyces sp. 604F]WDV33151.1 hypothetical protein OIM90_23120 [Streptomyces sp. AD16]